MLAHRAANDGGAYAVFAIASHVIRGFESFANFVATRNVRGPRVATRAFDGDAVFRDFARPPRGGDFVNRSWDARDA